MIWINLRRFFESRLCLRPVAFLEKDDSLDIQHVGVAWSEFDGFVQIFFGRVEFVLIQCLHSLVECLFRFRRKQRFAKNSRTTLRNGIAF